MTKLIFPFTYPPICHPSTILVAGTNIDMPSVIDLNLDIDNKMFEVCSTFSNFDVLLSPLQIYTISHFIDYAGFLFDQYNIHPDKPSPTVIINPESCPEAPSIQQPSTKDAKIKTTLKICRTTIKILLDDTIAFKRYYHPYKSTELEVPGQIQAIQLKLPYNFLEVLIVGIKMDTNVGRSIECKGRVNYLNITTNILQCFALRKTGQVLDESMGTMYESVNRTFSIISEESNILSEDTMANCNRLHFCVQKVLELKASTSSCANKTIPEEWEYTIDTHLKALKDTLDYSQDGVSFEFKIHSEKTRTPKLVSINFATSGIVFDLSADIPVYIDQVLNPTGSMLLYQPTQYRQILKLYNIEPTNYKKREEVKEEIQTERKNCTLEQRDWALQRLEILIPYIRAKVWMIDTSKNTVLDFYKERNVDTCICVLQKVKNNEKTIIVKGNPPAAFQICRCMDLCRLANELSGITMKTSSMGMQFSYYRNELIVLDIANIKLIAREIYKPSVNGQVSIQAQLTDISIDDVSFYSNLSGKFSILSKIEFIQFPYSIRLLNRSCITCENSMMANANFIDEKMKFECAPEECFIVGVNKGNESEDVAQKELAQSLPRISEEEKSNPFVWESSRFSEREMQIKKSAKTFLMTNITNIVFSFNLEDIPVFSSLAESTRNTMEKIQSLLEGKEKTRNSIESYFKKLIKQPKAKKNEIKKEKLTIKKDIVDDKPSDSSDSEDAEKDINKSVKMEDRAINDTSLLGVYFSIQNISGYLCERKIVTDKLLNINPINEEFKTIESPTIPLFILKIDDMKILMYKNTLHDLNLKLQVISIVFVDNSLIPPPLYSFDYRIEEAKKFLSMRYKRKNLMKSHDDCGYFLKNHSQSVILYKEEGLKNNPIITISATIIDKNEFTNIYTSDMESECTINIGINGIIIRPELHTEAFNKLLSILSTNPQPEPNVMELIELTRGKSENLSINRMSSKKVTQAMNDTSFISRQILKVNLCLRNFTVDIWPAVQFSCLMEVDPPTLPPKFAIGDKQLYRTRQRVLFLLENLTIKYISAPFIGKEKLWGRLVDTSLAVTNCNDLKKTLLVDSEALLNSTISILNKVGYSNLVRLENLEINYSSHDEAMKRADPLPSVKIDMSSLIIEMRHDSLVTAIKGISFILAELERLTLDSTVSKCEDNVVTKEEKKVNVEKKSYEVNREMMEEELKFCEDLGKSTIQEDLEIVKQNFTKENITMRKAEKIDTGAMKNAFEMMNENPDYIMKEDETIEVNKEEIEEIIMDKDTEVTTTITKLITINSEYIAKPKEVIHQYETKYHSLPEGYDIPKAIFCVSISKVAFTFLTGSDLDGAEIKSTQGQTKKRKANSSIEISLQNIGLTISQFPEHKSKMLRATFSLEKLLGIENLSQSVLTTLLSTVNTETEDYVLRVCVEICNTNMKGEPQPELVLRLQVEPLEITLHQKVLEFVRNFALKCNEELFEYQTPEKVDAIKEEIENVTNNKVDSPILSPTTSNNDIFVQRMSISPFYIKLNYRSYKLNVTKLYNKEFFELLNITDIRDLIISFKKFDERGFNTIKDLVDKLVDFYAKDILDNQLMNCVTAVSPIRSITNIMGGFIDIFRLPVASYRKRKKVWSGLTEGVNSFFSKITSETMLVGETILNAFVNRIGGI